MTLRTSLFQIREAYHRSFLARAFDFFRQELTLESIPTDPWPGDIRMATMLLERYYTATIQEKITFWSLDEVKNTPYFHSFDWLRDLKSIGDSRSRRFSRALILSWIKNHKASTDPAWSPSITGERLSNFLCYYEFFAQSGDDRFLKIFHKTLFRHQRYLRFYALNLPPSYETFLSLKGAITATLAFKKTPASLDPLLSRLTKTLAQILYSDGFYHKEHPDVQVRLARHIIDIRNFLRQDRKSVV
jgi:uncharacterized heparinase superfamily protein